MQNIKNLVGNFGANYARIMLGNFQASSFTGVGGGGGGGRQTHTGGQAFLNGTPYMKFLNFSLRSDN